MSSLPPPPLATQYDVANFCVLKVIFPYDHVGTQVSQKYQEAIKTLLELSVLNYF